MLYHDGDSPLFIESDGHRGMMKTMYVSDDSKFNEDLRNAMAMIRDMRARSGREKWDPRAVRCALKFAMKVDDHFARGQITPHDEAMIETIAQRNLDFLLAHERRSAGRSKEPDPGDWGIK